MNGDHWVLIAGWCLFGLIHSVTADTRFREICQAGMGRCAVYYRLLYSLLALGSLTFVLFWQFSIPSAAIGTFPLLKYLFFLVAGLPGLVLMGASIRKYFFSLSGVSVFWQKEAGAVLEIGGLHRYMRHPLYLGTLLLVWSLFLFFPLLSNLLSCIMITLYTLAGIRLEERKLLLRFGSGYADYRRRTPMLIPRFRSIFLLR